MSYVAPWAAATALAVGLAWLGVRDVVRGAVSDRSTPPPTAGPVIHASPPDRSAVPGPEPGAAARPAPSSPSADDGSADEHISSYAARGGRAAMAISATLVRLVSATPNPGFETRVTEAEGWLRVDFLGKDHTSSVIATWYQHAPIVRVYEYGG
ncbi:MAG: hypothetical protein IRY90_08720 [Actinomadura rubrobrunea]|nr:hypothetical protein [Actinomadura rubrobrunea]